MEWLGWVLIVVVVVVPFALLCYSAVTTGLEIGRKVQPFVDSFLNSLLRSRATPDRELHALRHQTTTAVVKYPKTLSETASTVT